jgi:8-oxo-dGTP pyrophosphatase MutT (NUDIX family)
MLSDFDADFLKTLLRTLEAPGLPEDESFDPTAVFLLTYKRNNEPYLLAVLKADNRDYLWRNQVALPGGHINKNEGPLAAAYRELAEELGIDGSQVECIGSLGHFQTIAQKDIEVFLGIWNGNRETLQYDPGEISKILEFPIEELLKIHISNNFRGRVPDVTELVYPIQGVTVWGVTARIFHYFFESVLDNSRPAFGISPGNQPDQRGDQNRQA